VVSKSPRAVGRTGSPAGTIAYDFADLVPTAKAALGDIHMTAAELVEVVDDIVRHAKVGLISVGQVEVEGRYCPICPLHPLISPLSVFRAHLVTHVDKDFRKRPCRECGDLFEPQLIGKNGFYRPSICRKCVTRATEPRTTRTRQLSSTGIEFDESISTRRRAAERG
jgi:hypothetical protein